MQHENSSFGWVEGACVVLGFFILWSVELPERHTPALSEGKVPYKNGWQVGTSIRNVGISIFDFGCPHYPLPLFHHLLFLEDNCNPPPLPSPPYSISFSSSLLSSSLHLLLIISNNGCVCLPHHLIVEWSHLYLLLSLLSRVVIIDVSSLLLLLHQLLLMTLTTF